MGRELGSLKPNQTTVTSEIFGSSLMTILVELYNNRELQAKLPRVVDPKAKASLENVISLESL